MMLDFMERDWYKVFVVFLIMPINGVIIVKVDLLLGFLSILLHLPWFLKHVINKGEEK